MCPIDKSNCENVFKNNNTIGEYEGSMTRELRLIQGTHCQSGVQRVKQLFDNIQLLVKIQISWKKFRKIESGTKEGKQIKQGLCNL